LAATQHYFGRGVTRNEDTSFTLPLAKLQEKAEATFENFRAVSYGNIAKKIL
jgi:hypothetical protein